MIDGIEKIIEIEDIVFKFLKHTDSSGIYRSDESTDWCDIYDL